MECALEVDMGIVGRRVGVHGPAVTIIVSAAISVDVSESVV